VSLASDARVQIPMPGLDVSRADLAPAGEADPYLGDIGRSDRRHPL
jgi:hypothetical protein